MKLKINLIILTITLAMFVWSFSAGLVNISLPTISQFLDVNTSIASLIIIIHLIVLTSFLLIFGRLGDIVGYKKVFITGISLFTIASYFCSISLDITQLIIFRVIQGIGSAMLLSMVPAIIYTALPEKIRGRAFGYISLATTLGLSAGYGIGGIVTEYFGWNWIFLLNVPIGMVVIILSSKILPSSIKNHNNEGFDIIGAILIFISILLLVMSLDIGEDLGWSISYIIGSFIASIIFGIIFLIRESKYQYPLFDISIFKNLYVTISVIAAFLATLVFMGTIFLLPFYLELAMGYSTDISGLIILLPSLFMIFIGPISGYISDHFGSRIPVIFASISLIIAVFLLAIFDETIGLIFILTALCIRALSEGMFTPANNKLVMSHSPREKLGSVSSLLNTARYLGLVLGVVVFNTIFDNTISNKTAEIVTVPLNGAFHFNIPAEILLNGFQSAFTAGIIISIIVLLFSLLSKEKTELEDKYTSKEDEKTEGISQNSK